MNDPSPFLAEFLKNYQSQGSSDSWRQKAVKEGLCPDGLDCAAVAIALAFADYAHKDQLRRYTGEPYIQHPITVARAVAGVFPYPTAVSAALLHDTIEDTPVTFEDIAHPALGLGFPVANLVRDLTDVSRNEDGNREARKTIDLAHTAASAPEAKLVKLADLNNNSLSIVANDLDFAPLYLKEKRRLVEEGLSKIDVPIDSDLALAFGRLHGLTVRLLDVLDDVVERTEKPSRRRRRGLKMG